MTLEMWRQILVQSAYQVFVMLILMYTGNYIYFDKAFNLVTLKKLDDKERPTKR